MAEVFYGLVDENNILIEYFKVNEGDTDILNYLKEKYNATNIFKMDLSKEIASIGEAYWNGNRFVWPSPYPSWVFNDELNNWEPPIPLPEDNNVYVWNEETISWTMVPNLPTES